jgi:hypothetical protein
MRAKSCFVRDADGQGRPFVPQIDAIKPDLPDQDARFDDPCMIVVQQALHPTLGLLLRHRPRVRAVAAIHAHYVGVISELAASRNIFRPRPSQRHPLAVKIRHRHLRHVGAAHCFVATMESWKTS